MYACMRDDDIGMNITFGNVNTFYSKPYYYWFYEWYCGFDSMGSIKKTALIGMKYGINMIIG